MTDLLAMADALVNGEVRCEVCGVNPVVADPETDRLVLVDAEVYRDAGGQFKARCEGC